MTVREQLLQRFLQLDFELAVIRESFSFEVPQPFVRLFLQFPIVKLAFTLPFFMIFIQALFQTRFIQAELLVLVLQPFPQQFFLQSGVLRLYFQLEGRFMV
jgi:hypothetical protein